MAMIFVGEEKRSVNTNWLNNRPNLWSKDLLVVCQKCGKRLRFIDPCEGMKKSGYELQCGCASTAEEKEKARETQRRVKARALSREEQFIGTLQVIEKNLSDQFYGVKVELGGSSGQDITIRNGAGGLAIWVYWPARPGVTVLCDVLVSDVDSDGIPTKGVIARERSQMEAVKSGKQFCEVPSMVAIYLDDEVIEKGLRIAGSGTIEALLKRNITLYGISKDGNLYELGLMERAVNKYIEFRLKKVRSLGNIDTTEIDHPKPKSKLGVEKVAHWFVKSMG